MSRSDGTRSGDYTHRGYNAVLIAEGGEHDFGGWLAGILKSVAADLGSSDVHTAGRPGSREADLVQLLVKGTVGWYDYILAVYKETGR